MGNREEGFEGETEKRKGREGGGIKGLEKLKVGCKSTGHKRR